MAENSCEAVRISPRGVEMSDAVTVGARFTGTSTWTSFGPLKRLPSQTFTNRSSELAVPAVKVSDPSCAADAAKVVLAACTTPLTVKWPLVAAALLS